MERGLNKTVRLRLEAVESSREEAGAAVGISRLVNTSCACPSVCLSVCLSAASAQAGQHLAASGTDSASKWASLWRQTWGT